MVAHLVGGPPSRAVGDREAWGRDARIDLGPTALGAGGLEAAEPTLVPHEHDQATGHGEIHEAHAVSILHRGDDAAARTPDDGAQELDVHLGDQCLVVDLDESDALEVDEPEVHGDRVRDHGGLPICLSREQTDWQGPRPSPKEALVTFPWATHAAL